jgi:DNA-binding NarL/FixJ family response regulator
MKTTAPARRRRRRVLIVEDHPLTRMGLVQVINHEPDLRVCGEAGSTAQALDAVASAKPDLVITDISLPGKSGIELIKDLHALRPELPVLVVSMQDELLFAERVLRAGGRGYVMKDAGGGSVVEAARKVLDGKIHLSPDVTARILRGFAHKEPNGKPEKAGIGVEQLSDREFEIFRLIGEGRDRNEIARLLSLSIKTVDVHRLNIKKRFGLKSPAALAFHAIRWLETEAARPARNSPQGQGSAD